MLSFFDPLKHNFLIFHQNICSLLKKKDELEITIDNYKAQNKTLDIICLTETFLRKGTEMNVCLKNYKVGSSWSRDHERRGGSCILVRDGIDSIKLKIADSLSEKYNFECCGILIKNISLIIICIYRTPDSVLLVFFNKLNDLLKKINNYKTKNKIVICGDWNIDILKQNKHTQTLKGILENNNFSIHISTATRKKACIDIIASNIKDCKGYTDQIYLSDHNTCQLLSMYIKNHQKIKYWTEYKRDFCCENKQKFLNHIKSLTFNEVLQENDTNKSFNLFHDIFKLFFDLCFPIIKIQCNTKCKKIEWITKGLKNSCTNKRILYYSYIKSHKKNKEEKKNRYTRYSKLLQKCINNAQKIVNSKILLNAKNKCRASWKIVNNNINKQPKQNDINSIIYNDISYDNLHDITSIFNNFFINSNCNDILSNNYKTNNLSKKLLHSIYISPTSEDEIYRIINNLSNTNSVGYDDINTSTLKICSKSIAIPLTHIVNLSLENGIFPDRLKYSVVKPLYKKGDDTDLNNYRPITLIPILAKIFEKVMAKRIQSFITDNNIIAGEQFGFQTGKSTTLACFALIKKITECINEKIPNVALFLDMSKAFDFVNHNILLHKAFNYGLRGKANCWLTSYLENRKQCTEISRIEDKNKIVIRSEYMTIKNGVPQGSILGPLLFLIYVNDLPTVTKNDCFLFADDCTILFHNKNIDTLNTDINNTINDICNWMNNNSLQINISKTKAIQFRTYKTNKCNIKIEHNNNNIDIIKATNFLGITIDENCSWKVHIDMVCNKINRFVFALGRIRKLASLEIALQAYHGYIASVLRYGVIIWGNSVDIERAFRAQKKCLRAICNINIRDSCRPFFRKHKILTLPCLYISELCLFVKRHPVYFKINNERSNIRNTRKNKLCIPKIKLDLFSRNVYCMAIKAFNKLPHDIRDLPHEKNIFKNTINRWLVDKCFYSTREYLDCDI